MRVLIDADVFIALYNDKDALSKRTIQLFKKLKNEKVKYFTTYDVIDEVATKLSYFLTKKASTTFLKEIIDSETQIIFPTEKSFQKTINKIKSIRTKRVSFTDCANIVAYKEYDIDAIFSFDKIYPKEKLKILKP